MHLLDTVDYLQMCNSFGGKRFIHHRPFDGDEKARSIRYALTWNVYRALFNSEPDPAMRPLDVPAPEVRSVKKQNDRSTT